jgi:hypothetical protein
MDEAYRDRFISLWTKYFGDIQLPVAVFFTGDPPGEGRTSTAGGQCIIEMLPLAMKGKTLCFSAENRICGGARRYLGFADESGLQNFELFLSYGIPGRLKGERYKKTPELVREMSRFSPQFRAPDEFIVFKRWDKLSVSDEPQVIVFLAEMDTIAGLFTLANFDEADPNAVICPFGSGCSSIVYHPFRELTSLRPRCILGMFDISARPCVGENSLSFSIPYPKFVRMVDNMTESFLRTSSWKNLRRRR